MCLLQEQGGARQPKALPCPEHRNAQGRLFAASAEDVPAVIHPEQPLQFPIHVGTVTQPLQPLEVGSNARMHALVRA